MLLLPTVRYVTASSALAQWASVVGGAFEKERRKTRKERGENGKERLIVVQEAGDPPLESALTWGFA